MAVRERMFAPTVGAVPPPPPPTDALIETKKSVQVSMAVDIPKPVVSDFSAANENVGAMRIIAQPSPNNDRTQDVNYFKNTIAAFADPFVAAGIDVICCLIGYPGISPVRWRQKITDWLDNVQGCRYYEVGNEQRHSFNYNGVNGTDWSQWFNCLEDAADVVNSYPGLGAKMLAGAPDTSDHTATHNSDGTVRSSTLGYFDFAESRAVKVSSFVDAFAAHPYGSVGATYSRTTSINNTLAKLQRIANVTPQSRHTVITEWGLGTDGNVESGFVINNGTGTLAARETEQAGFLTEAFNTLWSRRALNDLKLEYITWFWRRDADVVSPKWWQRCGYYRFDGTTKPSRASFKAQDVVRLATDPP